MKSNPPLPTTSPGTRAWCLRWAAACLRCAMISGTSTTRRRADLQNARAWLRQARQHNGAVLP